MALLPKKIPRFSNTSLKGKQHETSACNQQESLTDRNQLRCGAGRYSRSAEPSAETSCTHGLLDCLLAWVGGGFRRRYGRALSTGGERHLRLLRYLLLASPGSGPYEQLS